MYRPSGGAVQDRGGTGATLSQLDVKYEKLVLVYFLVVVVGADLRDRGPLDALGAGRVGGGDPRRTRRPLPAPGLPRRPPRPEPTTLVVDTAEELALARNAAGTETRVGREVDVTPPAMLTTETDPQVFEASWTGNEHPGRFNNLARSTQVVGGILWFGGFE